MPFLNFGKKKDKDEGDDLVEEEESGLLMSTKGDQAGPAGESAPEPLDELDPDANQEQATDAETPEEEAAGEGDPLLEAAPADPAAEAQGTAEAAVDAGDSGKSDAADLMAAFQDEESDGDLADILVGVDDIAASALLEELREIRSELPPEALDQGESAA